jgi:hypothetical protein
MKKLFIFILVCSILTPVFSQETGKLEIGTGVESLFITGYYDPDGELVETSGDPACYMFFVSVAYEFFPGFKA